MFTGLGFSVRGGNHRVHFGSAIEWSAKYLCKDDRIVWYLSILQRFAYLQVIGKQKSIPRKLENKINRKLRGFDLSRVEDDFSRFQQSHWEHFANIQAVFSHPSMLDYRFYDEIGNKLHPKSAREVIGDFEKLENDLQEKGGGQRFCNDGIPLLEFDDGWKWFVVDEGYSRQEAMAMRHCGNGDGNSGDQLLSLREPVRKPHGVCWKPHLTFILKDGFLGEMKGFANQKPDSVYHKYIEKLLKSDGVFGIRGGGYLPQNNFDFNDLPENSRIRILEHKPNFDFDLFGMGGRTLLSEKKGKWKYFGVASCPEQAMSYLNLDNHREPQWLAYQSSFSTSKAKHKNTLAFCAFEKGCVSKLQILNQWVDTESLASVLRHPMVKVVQESLLQPESTWDKLLSVSELGDLMRQKPGVFRNTPVRLIYEEYGFCEGFVEVINDQLNLNLKLLEDGVELLSFASISSFARRTGIGSLIRSCKNLRRFPTSYCSDPFQLGWLTFRKRKCQHRPIYLHLHKSALMYLLESLQLSGRVTPRALMQELVYRFGPPDIFHAPKLLAA